MRRFVCLLSTALVLSAAASFVQATVIVERGPTVGEKVRQLRQTNIKVRAALAAFEKTGHMPKIDDAVVMKGTPGQLGARRNHAQDIQYGDGVELITITTIDLLNEFQGTVIANFYDTSGAEVDQYVADVVITRPYETSPDWSCRFVLKFEDDGVGYLNHVPGMFTAFALGTPIAQQRDPLYLAPWQFQDTEQQTEFYAIYTQQATIDDLKPTSGGSGGIGIITNIYHHARRGQIGPVNPAQVQQVSRWATNPFAGLRVVGWGATAQQIGQQGFWLGASCTIAGAISRGAATWGCIATGMSLIVPRAAYQNLRVVGR